MQKRTDLQLLAMAEVCEKPPGTKKPRIDLGFSSGAKRIRTADPLHAMQVLYQLSYGPKNDGLALEQIVVVVTLHREDPKPAARQRRAFPEPALDLQAAQSGNRPGSRPPAQQWIPDDGNA